jgi:hypothetical protein
MRKPESPRDEAKLERLIAKATDESVAGSENTSATADAVRSREVGLPFEALLP